MTDHSDQAFPESDTGAEAQRSRFRVQGKCVIVLSGGVLPPFCVVTNQPVQSWEVETKQLTWFPYGLHFFWIAFGWLPFFVGYFLTKEHCAITYGLSYSVRRKQHQRFVLAVVSTTLTFVSLLLVNLFPSALLCCVLALLTCATAILWTTGIWTLEITDYRGNEFWISGCSKEFLRRIDPPIGFPFAAESSEGTAQQLGPESEEFWKRFQESAD